MLTVKYVVGLNFVSLFIASMAIAQLPPPLSVYPPPGVYPPLSWPYYGPLAGPGSGLSYQSYYGGGFGPLDPRFSAYDYAPPRSVLIDSQVVANAPLPPARIVLSHARNETLRVEVYDRKKRQQVFGGDIPPGQSVELTLPRDAGGVVNETYQSYGPYGELVQRNVTRALPITVRYDVVVHQWKVQSIAIDRTGKSPSPIEDINYQGKGVGRFVLPAGPQLIDGQIDIYRNAVEAGNQGLVAPLQAPAEDDGPTSDPLRSVIEELRQSRGPR